MFEGLHNNNDRPKLSKAGFRLIIVIILICAIAAGLIYRLFTLQIVNGENYQNSFQLRIRRELSISSTRGNIYDRNGNVLAYNELCYSVTIKDLGEDSGTEHSKSLNETISKAIDIIEEHGDEVTATFDVVYDADSDSYSFDVSGASLLRFLADVYGYQSTDELTDEERNKTADDVVADLVSTYSVDTEGLSKQKILQIVTVRYLMNLNSYQKYVSTTIASDVSDATVSAIMESTDSLDGIDIEDDTKRVYVDSKYFSHLLGYTGTVSSSELEELQKTNPDYDANDIVGKSGIEQACESVLQGTKGTETVYVDNLGKILETTDVVEPVSGEDVYLTIDMDLTEAVYDIIEKKLAEILVAKLDDVKTYEASESDDSTTMRLAIYDVYYQMINNDVLDMDHFSADDASSTEKAVYQTFTDYQQTVLSQIPDMILTSTTAYQDLDDEHQEYESYIVQYLKDEGILDTDKINTDDETYIAWTTDETISLHEFLQYCIEQNWIDASLLSMDSTYTDTEGEFQAISDYLVKYLADDQEFSKKIYHWLIQYDMVTGVQICLMLGDQGVLTIDDTERGELTMGDETAYDFMISRISSLDITPAQVALDPCTASCVITDPQTGDVLALVTYPGYDNNKMANGVDADYYEKLRNDESNPLLNYATQQRTAPGSTFKPVVATAALMEGTITTDTEFTCNGYFTKIGTPYPRCWIYPASHGTLKNLSEAITDSCNVYFYNVGYNMSLDENGDYDSAQGVELLSEYADMYGLGDKSGIEIDEADSLVSTEDAVRTAIGQGSASYTTVDLARYVTTLANRGTCYYLTLIDKYEDSDGNVVEDNSAQVRNQIEMDDSYWDAIQTGMEGVVEDKAYFDEIPVTVAGKTGTAQESNTRPNHALFISYAPSDNASIAMAVRVAYGYTSDYAAQIAEEIYAYYFGVSTVDEIVGDASGITDSYVTAGD